MATELANELLTVAEVSQRLRCFVKTVRRLVVREGLPALKLGPRCLRFHWPSIVQWGLRKKRFHPERDAESAG